MDRASDSGSEGWGFESLPVYQKSRYPFRDVCFFSYLGDGTRKIKSQYAGGILLQPVQKLVATIIFALAKMQTSPFRCTITAWK